MKGKEKTTTNASPAKAVPTKPWKSFDIEYPIFIVIFIISLFVNGARAKVGAAFLLVTTLLAICLKKSYFVSFHSFIWRFILAWCIILTSGFIAMCFVRRDYFRIFFAFLDPIHAGIEEPERDYSTACAIWDTSNPQPFHNVLDVLDIYVVAHFVGYIGKALVVRNYGLCWVISFAFEVVERSLKFWLPNFAECWWDSLILDVLLSNGIGIWVGMTILRFLPAKTKFGNFTKFEWNSLDHFRNYSVTLLVLFLILLVETNIFFLKQVLFVTPESWLIAILTTSHGLLGLPATAEAFLYATNKTQTLGLYAKTLIVMGLSEVLAIIRMREGFFMGSPQWYVILWTSAIAVVTFLVIPLVSWFKNKKTYFAPQTN